MATRSGANPTVTATVINQPNPGQSSQSNQPGELSSSQFASLMAAIKSSETRLDQKLAEFKSDVQQAQEEAATKAANRVRREKPFEFKKKAHEEQAIFNEKVEDAVKEAQAALSSVEDSPALQRAQEALEKGARLLSERQKLIKIADRSVNGWSVVAEYTADELADDSEDEKRIEKAEKAAERKAGLRKRKRAQPVVRQTPPARATRYAAQQLYYPMPSAPQPSPGGSGGPSGRRTYPAAGPAVPRVIGPCFSCGEMGHLRMYCPKMQPQEKKLYPPHDIEFMCGCDCVGECCGSNSVGVDGCGSNVVDTIPDTASRTAHSQKSVAEHSMTSASRLSVADNIGVGPDSVGVEWEMEGNPTALHRVTVKGRLKQSISFWKEEIRACAAVIGVIENGYVLPLKSEPTAYVQVNHISAKKNSSFVEESITALCAAGCVVEVAQRPHICSPLSVVESGSGKKRLVINLRHLNRFLWKQKFKYEDLRVAMLLLEQGDYMFSFDLKSGYHHVDIAKEHWKYLGFAWGKQFYVFTVLPFGLSSACYIFTKMVRPLVKYWRAKGLRVIVYLDDGLCAVDGESNALVASQLVRSTLEQAGFVANVDKSIWTPTQRLQWLGFVIDLSKGQIEVPTEKVVALRSKLQVMCQLQKVQAKQLASVVGSIISMSLAL